MACKMLFFDYRKPEEHFFKKHKLENFDIKFFEESLNESTLNLLTEEDFENTMIISVFISSTIDENIISRFKNLRVISTRSTGYDHICINSCVEKNVTLLNVDSYGSIAVAQFTMAVILMLVRNIFPALQAVKNSSFDFENLCGRDLNSLTLGVIGTGAIGSSVCKYAHAFGMKILAYDIVQKKELISDADVKYVEMDELLKRSDIVTLHFPYFKENYHLFSTKQFEMMKQGSYFINVSRGEVVDTEALLEFAKKGKFKGVAVDVVACPDLENVSGEIIDKSSVSCMQTSEVVKELEKLPNVILTPHMAYDTQEAVDYILEMTFEGLQDFLTGGHKHRVI